MGVSISHYFKAMKDQISTVIDQRISPISSGNEDSSFVVEKNKDKVNGSSSISHIEKVLLSRLQAGDYSAFSNVFSAYYRDLVIFASRYTNDLSFAEELVQDTFVMLWEDRCSIRINTSLKSYLLKTVQNKCIDWFRHKKIVKAHQSDVFEKPPQLSLSTDSYLLYSELNERVENALKLLPDPISEAFRLNRQKGLKYAEIAEISGVSVRTIEVRIGKALHLLRRYLKDYFVVILVLVCSGCLF
jgi:RNA polymerase sigma-70 factor (ECF subfamily)